MGTVLGKLLIRMGLDDKPLLWGIKSSKQKIGSFEKSVSKSTSRIGGELAGMAKGFLGVGAAVAVLGDAARITVDFQKAVSTLAATSGKSVDELDDLVASAKLIGSVSSFTATEVIALQTELSKLGFNEADILASTKAIGAFSVAVGTDAAQAAEFAGATLRGFGLQADEATRVAETLAVATTKSALNFEKLQISMAIVAPVAKNSNVSLERTTALLGVLTDRGVDASTAGTALRNIFIDLAAKGLTYEQAMDKIAKSTNKNNTAAELFGKRGATVAAILSENEQAAQDLESSITGVNGALDTMSATRLDNVAGSMTLARSAWEGLVLSIDSGNGVISKTVKSLIDDFAGLLTTIRAVNEDEIDLKSIYNWSSFTSSLTGQQDIYSRTMATIANAKYTANKPSKEKIGKYTLSAEIDLLKSKKEALSKTLSNLTPGAEFDATKTELNEIATALSKAQRQLLAIENLNSTTNTTTTLQATTYAAGTLGAEIDRLEKRQKALKEALLGLNESSGLFTVTSEKLVNVTDTLAQKRALLNQTIKQDDTISLSEQYRALENDIRNLTEAYVVKPSSSLLDDINAKSSQLDEVRRQIAETEKVINSLGRAVTEVKPLPSLGVTGIKSATPTPSLPGIKTTASTYTAEQDYSLYSELGNSLANGISNAFNTSVMDEAKGKLIGLKEELLSYQRVASDPTVGEAQRQAAIAHMGILQQQIKTEKDRANTAKSAGRAIINSIRDVIKAKLAEAVAGAIASNASLGPAALVAAPIAAAGITALFDSMVPKLAKGGVLDSPTFFLGGEYSGAANNKEIVTPENLMKQVFTTALNEHGAGGHVQVHGILEGDQIYLTNKRASRASARVY